MTARMRALLRRAYFAFLPQRARDTMGLYLLLGEFGRNLGTIETFSAGNVLVLAPHMDDEIIGCGGTLRRHVLAGARVTVLFMTDGSRSHRDLHEDSHLSRADIAREEAQLVTRRKEESQRAAAIVGIQEIDFLDAPDGRLDATPQVVEKLVALLRATQPDIIYLPSMLDGHTDHWATHRVLGEAMRTSPPSPKRPVVFREYEVWRPLLANRLADIGDVFDVKRKALEQFESQNARIDYVRATTGLNMYRSIHRQRGAGYAEAFLESTAQEYRLMLARFQEQR